MEFDNLITLIKTVSESCVTKFQYEEDGAKICIKKDKTVTASDALNVKNNMMVNGGSVTAPDHHTENNGSVTSEEGHLIKSPLVGRFYAAPAEDAAPFVSVGDHVKKGQIVAIVEAMKLMNDIESDFDGVVAEILVENGETVEYGQPLLRMKGAL